MSAAAEIFARKGEAALGQGTSNHAIYDMVMRRLASEKTGGDFLDFGAGRGHLLSRVASTGEYRTVTGADLFPAGPDIPSEWRWIQADLNQPLPGEGARFDVIVSSEVIEHLENPRAMARDLFRLLRPGGMLVLTTPNNESLRSLLALWLRGHFLDFGHGSYPAHITALVREDLRRILAEAGFEVGSFEYTDDGPLPKLTFITWRQVSFGLLRGVRFSNNLSIVGRKPRERG